MSTYLIKNVSDEDLDEVRMFGRVERLNEGTYEVKAYVDDEVDLISYCFHNLIEINWES